MAPCPWPFVYRRRDASRQASAGRDDQSRGSGCGDTAAIAVSSAAPSRSTRLPTPSSACCLQDFAGLHGNAELWVPSRGVGTGDAAPAPEPRLLPRGSTKDERHRAGRRLARCSRTVSRSTRRFRRSSCGTVKTRGARRRCRSTTRVLTPIVRRASFMLLGAVGFVLLIACVNLTNLIAQRRIGRRREVAVRMAIGASRFRVARQFLVGEPAARRSWCRRRIALGGGAARWRRRRCFRKRTVFPLADRSGRASHRGRRRPDAHRRRHDRARRGHAALYVRRCGAAAALIALVPALQASSLRPIEAMKTGRRTRAPRADFMRSASRPCS